MRFGHYTVFDTPEENKHTQVYVEYDVPNNDDLEGATGTIVLTEGGQGSGGGGDTGNGIRSISISPAITTTPALDSLFPIYYEDLTEEQKQEGLDVTLTAPNLPAGEYTVTVTPTDEWYARVGETTGTEKGEPVSEQFTINSGAPFTLLPNMIAFSNIPEGGEPDKYIAVAMAINKQ